MEKQRIIKNIGLNIAGQLCSWILAFVVNIYLPRYAGDSGLGKFAIVGSLISILSAVTTFGTTTVLVRDVARHPDKSQELFSAALWLRLILTVILCCGLLVFLFLSEMSEILRSIFVVNCLGLLFGAFNDAASAILQGREKFTYSNIVMLSDRVVSSLLVVVGIALHLPLWILAGLPIISAVAQSGLFIFLLSRMNVKWGMVSWTAIKSIALGGLPFLSLGLFRVIYTQTDPLVINFWSGDRPCGWYALALRLVGTALFLPSALYTVLFPWMARQKSNEGKNGEDKVITAGQRMAEINVLYGVVVAVFFAQSAPTLLRALHYPASFSNAAPVLALSGCSALAIGLGISFGGLLSALNRQGILWRLALGACMVGIPLCFFLSYISHRLWHNAAIGALASDIILELFLITGYLLALPRGVWNWSLTSYTIRCLCCGVGMALVQGVLYNCGIGLWSAVAGIFCYFLLCLPLQLLGKREWDLLSELIKYRKVGT